MVCKNSPNTFFEFFLFGELISLALSVKQFARPRRRFVLMLILKWVTRVRQRQGQSREVEVEEEAAAAELS